MVCVLLFFFFLPVSFEGCENEVLHQTACQQHNTFGLFVEDWSCMGVVHRRRETKVKLWQIQKRGKGVWRHDFEAMPFAMFFFPRFTLRQWSERHSASVNGA